MGDLARRSTHLHALPVSRARAADDDLPVLHLKPPYRTIPELVPSCRLRPAHLGLGSILAIPAAALPTDAHLLAPAVHRMRARFPRAPVIFWWAGGPERAVVELAIRAGRLHVRALLLGDQPIVETLRPVLTSHEELAEDTGDWLHLQGFPASPGLAHLVGQIFALAPLYTRIQHLLDSIGEVESSVRAKFRKRRLPPPHRWLQAARALHAALEVQGRPGEPLLRIAEAGGYCDAAALSKQLHAAFGIRPSALRGTLGWEWLLDRWAEREGVVPPKAGEEVLGEENAR